MTLDEAGKVIDPNVGDAELVGLDFTTSGATIRIKLASDSMLVLLLSNVRWMSFSTDHTQNVINEVVVADADASTIGLAPRWVQEALWVRGQRISGDQHRLPPPRTITITPKTGPSLVVIADEIRDQH